MFYPLAGMILVSIVWSVYWWIASTKAESLVASQRTELAARGLQLQCDRERWGGFPFRFEFTCEGVSVHYAEALLKAGKVLAVAQAYNPFHILFLVNGPSSLASADQPLLIATHDDALISLTINTAGDWDVSSDVAHLNVAEIFSATAMKVFARQIRGKIDVAGNADGLIVVGENTVKIPFDHAEVLGKLNGPTSLDISSLKITSGDIAFEAAGNLGLDGAHSLAGHLATKTNNVDELLKLIAPLFAFNDKDQTAIKSLLATQANGVKPPAQKAEFTGRDGGLYWEQFKIADLDPIY